MDEESSRLAKLRFELSSHALGENQAVEQEPKLLVQSILLSAFG